MKTTEPTINSHTVLSTNRLWVLLFYAEMSSSMSSALSTLVLFVNRSNSSIRTSSRRRKAYAKSRRKVLVTLVGILLSTAVMELCNRQDRTIWMHPRSSNWWEDVVLQSFGSRDWLENFRISRATFNYLCEQLRPLVEKETTVMRKPVSVERRVAIILWILATPSEYRTVAHLFGIARCTIGIIVKETCKAIVQKLVPLYIRFPTGEGLKEVITGFKEKWGVPQCAGSVDGTHILITPPLMNHTDYYNRKGWYSVVTQAVVDHNGIFRDVYVGWPGSMHDAQVFTNSSLYRKANNGELLQGNTLPVRGGNIPIFLIGDSAYPLLPWLLKPFPFFISMLTDHKTYNYRLSRGWVIVEIAFGKLKARWRRLSKQIDMDISNVPNVILACCTLHNICEIHNDSFNDEWLQQSNDFDQPDSTDAPVSTRSNIGNRVRDLLATYFN